MGFPIELLSRVADTQGGQPRVPVGLSRVGVKNLKLSLRISGKRGGISLFPTVDIFVDLPGERRGVHLSRDPESLYETLVEQGSAKSVSVEEFCERVALRVLDRHEYATRAEVRLRSDYVTVREEPGLKLTTQEPCKIFAMATANRESQSVNVSRVVGVRVTGFTACPCTQELMRTLVQERLSALGYRGEEAEKILAVMPLMTHSQRTNGTILLQVPRGRSVNLEDLVGIVEDSMSASTHTLLKRANEAAVVEQAATRPRFAEDVVREALLSITKRYQDFPDETRVFVQALSQESVHKHDAIAERVASLGDIRKEISDADVR
ncbi:MAG: GTP cyclohydrolase MptA [Candidatus Bathyarchaeia archaeon]